MATRQEEAALREALWELDPQEREVLLLHFAEGLSQSAIAERLGVNRSTVHRQMRRALGSLRVGFDRVLAEAAPKLRMRRETAARTATLVCAAVALPVSAQAALASAAGLEVTFETVGFLVKIKAALAAGGQTMAIGKGILATFAAATLLSSSVDPRLMAQSPAGTSRSTISFSTSSPPPAADPVPQTAQAVSFEPVFADVPMPIFPPMPPMPPLPSMPPDLPGLTPEQMADIEAQIEQAREQMEQAWQQLANFQPPQGLTEEQRAALEEAMAESRAEVEQARVQMQRQLSTQQEAREAMEQAREEMQAAMEQMREQIRSQHASQRELAREQRRVHILHEWPEDAESDSDQATEAEMTTEIEAPDQGEVPEDTGEAPDTAAPPDAPPERVPFFARDVFED